MFLGTPRGWWIASGILFIGGIALIGSGYGGGLGTVGGVLCLFLGMGIFAAAPMRGRGSAARQEQVTPRMCSQQWLRHLGRDRHTQLACLH